jgi:integrase
MTLRYVLVAKFCAESGYSEKAVRRKIEEGIWVENHQFRRAPDGRIFIDIQGIERWVEGQLAPSSLSSIRLKFTVNGTRCVETLALEPKPANIKAAERMLERIQAAIRAGVYRREDFFDTPGKATARQTFSDYADEWLKTIVVAKSTMRSYKTALNASWTPAFGGLPLQQIRYSDVKKVVANRAKAVSGKTVNNHLIVLRAIFETAANDGFIEEKANPVRKIENLKHQAPEADPFEREEVDLILKHMRTRYDEQVANYYDFAFHTGLRPSEQIALRWPDIDWRHKRAKIERARVDWEEKDTKTSTVREIDLNDRELTALQRPKPHTFMRNQEGEVFHNPNTGKPWPDEQVQRRRYFNPTLTALGIRHRDAYQTRHTFATTLLMGESIRPTSPSSWATRPWRWSSRFMQNGSTARTKARKRLAPTPC